MSRVAEKMPTSYAEARALLRGRSRVAIANNTRLETSWDGTVPSPIHLVHHWTPIATFEPEGAVILRTGGYHSVTTLGRLRPIARALGFLLAKRAGEVTLACVSEPRVRFRFFEGIRLVAGTMDTAALRAR